jgi:hypothetical protein
MHAHPPLDRRHTPSHHDGCIVTACPVWDASGEQRLMRTLMSCNVAVDLRLARPRGSALGPCHNGRVRASAVTNGHQRFGGLAGRLPSGSCSWDDAGGRFGLWSRRSRVQVPSVTPPLTSRFALHPLSRAGGPRAACQCLVTGGAAAPSPEGPQRAR